MPISTLSHPGALGRDFDRHDIPADITSAVGQLFEGIGLALPNRTTRGRRQSSSIASRIARAMIVNIRSVPSLLSRPNLSSMARGEDGPRRGRDIGGRRHI